MSALHSHSLRERYQSGLLKILDYCSFVHYIFSYLNNSHIDGAVRSPPGAGETSRLGEGANDAHARERGCYAPISRPPTPVCCSSSLSRRAIPPPPMTISTGRSTSISISSSTPRRRSLSGWLASRCRKPGFTSGDVLIVDRALTPSDGSVVIAVVNGELTVKRLSKRHGKLVLMPENQQYPPLPITGSTAFEVWGVVTYVIHRV